MDHQVHERVEHGARQPARKSVARHGDGCVGQLVALLGELEDSIEHAVGDVSHPRRDGDCAVRCLDSDLERPVAIEDGHACRQGSADSGFRCRG